MRTTGVVQALASSLALLVSTAIAGTDDWATSRIRLKQKAFTVINRSRDIAISDDGKSAYVCVDLGDVTLLRLNALTGEVVERVGNRESSPQCILYCRGDLFLVMESRRTGRTAVSLDQYATDQCLSVEKSLPLHDWRLYRISSACVAPDGHSLWLASSPNMSSLYGRVDPALFRVQLPAGSMTRVLGPPPDRMTPAATPPLQAPLVATIDEDRGIVVVDPSESLLRFYEEGESRESAQMKIELTPRVVPPRIRRFLPLVADRKGVMIDTVTREIVSRFDLPDLPTAVCVNSTGTHAFIAVRGSNNALVVDVRSGDVSDQVDLSRPTGAPGIRDAVRGQDVHDVIALRWADNPGRLLALGYNGQIFIVATLESQKQENTPQNLPVSMDGSRP